MHKQLSQMLSNGALPYGMFLFFFYMLAKAPLLVFGFGELSVWLLFFGVATSLLLMMFAVFWLLLLGKFYAAAFVFLFNLLFFFGLLISDFNAFGFFNYYSLSLFLSIAVLGYCLTPKRHSLAQVLLVFAGMLLLYGTISVFWGVANGVKFSLRDATIGINGPIVFGQLMISASAIYFLYGKRQFLAGCVSAGLSLVSFSKGPVLAGLFILLLKRKVFLVPLVMLCVGAVLMFPESVADNRFLFFVKSVYQLLVNSDTNVLFSGKNYGSVGLRIEQYFLAANLLSNYPFGVGLGNWIHFSVLDYPHNYVIEVLVEQGLFVGSCSLILVFALILKAVDVNLKYLFVMFFLFSMFSGSIIDNRGIYFIVLLGLLYRDNCRGSE